MGWGLGSMMCSTSFSFCGDLAASPSILSVSLSLANVSCRTASTSYREACDPNLSILSLHVEVLGLPPLISD